MYVHSKRLLLLACLLALGLSLGCGSSSREAALLPAATRAWDETPSGFDFLPPLSERKAGLAGLNTSAKPMVEVYAGTEASKGDLIKQFAPAEITVETDHFQVDWDTGAATGGLPSGTEYCVIEVRWGSTLMGYVDCQIDKSKGNGKNAADEGFFALKDGRTLPIKFIIDQTVAAPCQVLLHEGFEGTGPLTAFAPLFGWPDEPNYHYAGFAKDGTQSAQCLNNQAFEVAAPLPSGHVVRALWWISRDVGGGQSFLRVMNTDHSQRGAGFRIDSSDIQYIYGTTYNYWTSTGAQATPGAWQKLEMILHLDTWAADYRVSSQNDELQFSIDGGSVPSTVPAYLSFANGWGPAGTLYVDELEILDCGGG
ncbi:MAG: hypothetical protein HYU66_05535 [Armatimonadetes bacterium]|nr:hypothetical protein [Armatimonadota bacterium]